MATVAVEAKPDLGDLLERVAAGEEIRLTRGGRPVARLSPDEDLRSLREDDAERIERLKAGRRGLKLDGLTTSDLRDAGRR